MNKISQTVPFQFDTSFSPFKASEFDEALEFLETHGFTGAELAIAYPAEVDASLLDRKLESHHLTATTLSTGQIVALKGLYLSSFDDNIRSGAIKIIFDHVDLSASLGFPPVTIGLIRGKREKGDKRGLLENLKASVSVCAEYAYRKGVTLQIEPICSAETDLINSVYEALQFMEQLGNPDNLGLLYDTFHSNIEDGGMPEAIKACAGRITNVHFADSDRGLPGYGKIDFSKVFEAIQNTGYHGAYALETLNKPTVDFVKENCSASIFGIVR